MSVWTTSASVGAEAAAFGTVGTWAGAVATAPGLGEASSVPRERTSYVTIVTATAVRSTPTIIASSFPLRVPVACGPVVSCVLAMLFPP